MTITYAEDVRKRRPRPRPDSEDRDAVNRALGVVGTVIPALSTAAAELSQLPTPTQDQQQALAHVLEALSLVRVPMKWSEEHGGWQIDR